MFKLFALYILLRNHIYLQIFYTRKSIEYFNQINIVYHKWLWLFIAIFYYNNTANSGDSYAPFNNTIVLYHVFFFKDKYDYMRMLLLYQYHTLIFNSCSLLNISRIMYDKKIFVYFVIYINKLKWMVRYWSTRNVSYMYQIQG